MLRNYYELLRCLHLCMLSGKECRKEARPTLRYVLELREAAAGHSGTRGRNTRPGVYHHVYNNSTNNNHSLAEIKCPLCFPSGEEAAGHAPSGQRSAGEDDGGETEPGRVCETRERGNRC